MYTIIIPDDIQKKIRKLPKTWLSKIARVLNNLAENPYQGKKLHADYHGRYAVRAWPYRIIYTIDRERITVVIVDLGHRKDIYR